MKKKTAILVDGSFFLKRYRSIRKIKKLDPKKTAEDLYTMCWKHTKSKDESFDLYRIFYYDCLPYDKKHHNPITKKSIDFSKTEKSKFQLEFLNELKTKRKVALRLGVLGFQKNWIIESSKTMKLLSKEIGIDDLTENDVRLNLTQKGVDIKIGLDIASMALKKTS